MKEIESSIKEFIDLKSNDMNEIKLMYSLIKSKIYKSKIDNLSKSMYLAMINDIKERKVR